MSTLESLTPAVLSSAASALAEEFVTDASDFTDAKRELEKVCQMLRSAGEASAGDKDSGSAVLAELFAPGHFADADAIVRFRDAVRGLIEDDERDVALAVSFLLGWRCRGIVEEGAALETLLK